MCRELAQSATTDEPAIHGHASPLVIGEPQAPPAELLAEHARLMIHLGVQRTMTSRGDALRSR